jgi:hypothetical protein
MTLSVDVGDWSDPTLCPAFFIFSIMWLMSIPEVYLLIGLIESGV